MIAFILQSIYVILGMRAKQRQALHRDPLGPGPVSPAG